MNSPIFISTALLSAAFRILVQVLHQVRAGVLTRKATYRARTQSQFSPRAAHPVDLLEHALSREELLNRLVVLVRPLSFTAAALAAAGPEQER